MLKLQDCGDRYNFHKENTPLIYYKKLVLLDANQSTLPFIGTSLKFQRLWSFSRSKHFSASCWKTYPLKHLAPIYYTLLELLVNICKTPYCPTINKMSFRSSVTLSLLWKMKFIHRKSHLSIQAFSIPPVYSSLLFFFNLSHFCGEMCMNHEARMGPYGSHFAQETWGR